LAGVEQSLNISSFLCLFLCLNTIELFLMTRLLHFCCWVSLCAWFVCPSMAWAAPPASKPVLSLRVVGGLANVPQFTDFEEPFWRKEFASLTQGLARADIVSFDKAGIRAHEAMKLMSLGVVPFGTALLTAVMSTDPELAAMDLAGLNPDMSTLKRSVAVFRPHFEQVMRERHGIEVLAIYVYPAQVTFCNRPFKGLSDLVGRRVRISSPTQADLIRAFGGVPVQTEFAEIVSQMRSGNVDCAVTGAMSGNVIGLHGVTTHLHNRAINWGLSVFAANRAAWLSLPDEVRKVLQTALPKLENSIWQDADRQHREGVACNTGRAGCQMGKAGKMQEVPVLPEDEQRLRQAFQAHVLPSWVERCGASCVPIWNQFLAPIAGVEAAASALKH
jgi:TRAP-type C4-dicarboxylate transport system substrate-binding protein